MFKCEIQILVALFPPIQSHLPTSKEHKKIYKEKRAAENLRIKRDHE